MNKQVIPEGTPPEKPPSPRQTFTPLAQGANFHFPAFHSNTPHAIIHSRPPQRSSQPPKRQKISLACQECRSRKTKCDGARPVCGACQKKKRPSECVYEPDRGRRGVKSQYIQYLENKVRELESSVRSDHAAHDPSSISKQDAPSSEPSTSAAEVAPDNLTPDSTPFQSSPSPIAPNNIFYPTSSMPAEPTTSSVSTPSVQSGFRIESIINNEGSTSRNSHPLSTEVDSSSGQDDDNPGWSYSDSPYNDSASHHRDTRSESRGEIEVDAMGAVTRNPEGHEMLDNSENRIGYFGSSSAMSFMREVRQAIGKRTALGDDYVGGSLFDNQSHNDARRPSQSSRSSRTTTGHLSVDSCDHPKNYSSVLHDYVLPPRKVAEDLVWSYWTYVHTLYPFLHRPSFMKTYARLWTFPHNANADQQTGVPETSDDDNNRDYESEADPLFQCILNLVFALGCQLSPDISESEREPASDVFFQRSKKLLQFDILEAGSIKVVQALLLMGQYLQCTKMPGRCWIVVGLATRVAQGLGLHMVGRNEKSIGTSGYHQRNVELHKRLWGGCIILDRVISMAYGRPFMIPVTRELILPQVIDDDLLTSPPNPPAKQPENCPSQMAFFVHTLSLYEIMGDILTTLYSIDNRHPAEAHGLHMHDRKNTSLSSRGDLDGHNRTEHLNSIIRLEIALKEWEQSIPWFLRLDSRRKEQESFYQEPVSDQILIRQTNVLRARYLHTCILLYRPLFVHFFASAESQPSSSEERVTTELQKSLFLQSSKACVAVALELVEIIHSNLKRHLPAWWYNVFYLYTSATVLLMARLFPLMKQTIGEDRLAESWKKCLGCLSEYQSYSGSAKGCYESLNELDKLAFQRNDEESNNNISTMQILGNLPSYNPNFCQPIPDANNDGNNFPVVDLNPGDCEFDLQDMSWLGRLPVYTDLEPGSNFTQWL